MDNTKIAAYITAKRKDKNLTQQQLAEMLHVTHKAVSKWETAKGMPDISIIPTLCSALDITPTEFFMGEDMPGLQSEDNRLILSVAEKYQQAGKKQMICFVTFLICTFVLAVVSFFGDGAGKLITLITAYLVSAIAVYKLGAISPGDIRQLQKFALICFTAAAILSFSLGTNYFAAKSSGIITVTNHISYLFYGDYSYTLQKFLLGFKNSAAAAALILGQNLYLLSAGLKNK